MSDRQTFIGVSTRVSAEWIARFAFHGRTWGSVSAVTTSNVPSANGDRLAGATEVRRHDVALVAFEPTGGYERILRRELVLAASPPRSPGCTRTQLAQRFRGRRGVQRPRLIPSTLAATRRWPDFAALELAGRGLAAGSWRAMRLCARVLIAGATATLCTLADAVLKPVPRQRGRSVSDRAESQTVRNPDPGWTPSIKVLEETLQQAHPR